MKQPLFVWLVIALSFMAGAARAAEGNALRWFDGNLLWGFCKSDPPSLICSGYVIGVADAMVHGQEGVGGWHACYRANQTPGQLTDVVKLWLQNHPEKRDYEGSGLVAEALAQAFPCSP